MNLQNYPIWVLYFIINLYHYNLFKNKKKIIKKIFLISTQYIFLNISIFLIKKEENKRMSFVVFFVIFFPNNMRNFIKWSFYIEKIQNRIHITCGYTYIQSTCIKMDYRKKMWITFMAFIYVSYQTISFFHHCIKYTDKKQRPNLQRSVWSRKQRRDLNKNTLKDLQEVDSGVYCTFADQHFLASFVLILINFKTHYHKPVKYRSTRKWSRLDISIITI